LCIQEHKNDYTCAGDHNSLFVVRHVGTARLDSLDTLVPTRSTCRTVERVESCVVETLRAKWNLGNMHQLTSSFYETWTEAHNNVA